MPTNDILDQLAELVEEVTHPNWDGHGAEPVKDQTIGVATRVIDALPAEYLHPSSVGAEPDGHVTLEWYRSTDWLLSVSVSPDGMLHYAASMGADSFYGACLFDGTVPAVILDLIRRWELTLKPGLTHEELKQRAKLYPPPAEWFDEDCLE